MKILSIAHVKAHLTTYIRESEGGPVVVTRNGRPVAVLVGVQDDEVERLILAHSRKLRTILEKSKQQIREGNWLGHEDFGKQVDAEHAEPGEPEKPRPKARTRKPRKP